MNDEIQAFFGSEPEAFFLYELLEERLVAEWNLLGIRVQKTQITFKNPRSFAAVWLPIRRMKNRSEHYIIVTFSLPTRLDSLRIAESVEVRPGRWTHHVIVSRPEEVNEELMGWIRSSYEYSLNKISLYSLNLVGMLLGKAFMKSQHS